MDIQNVHLYFTWDISKCKITALKVWALLVYDAKCPLIVTEILHILDKVLINQYFPLGRTCLVFSILHIMVVLTLHLEMYLAQ
jgi:hypothetical protein